MNKRIGVRTEREQTGNRIQFFIAGIHMILLKR